MNDDDWGNEILGVDDWMSILSENVCLRGLGLVWGEILSFLWMRCGISEVSATLACHISHVIASQVCLTCLFQRCNHVHTCVYDFLTSAFVRICVLHVMPALHRTWVLHAMAAMLIFSSYSFAVSDKLANPRPSGKGKKRRFVAPDLCSECSEQLAAAPDVALPDFP